MPFNDTKVPSFVGLAKGCLARLLDDPTVRPQRHQVPYARAMLRYCFIVSRKERPALKLNFVVVSLRSS